MIVDPQEVAPKVVQESPRARAPFFRKEFGRKLEADSPEECRQINVTRIC